ncbi:SMP-30/gluconolactonase/LRE family protein [Variovorax sp. Root318D1]|uniref:SMP-30/gluconolactonase/LRE family protein n=1 Tax=Variovorax sp. Root318D1 TaxID=1736513 RepID=UPI000ACA1009|nr:SMP-30/gluconolactonase/LRE family protein [Variovorax sp. Root318D1]
MGIAVADLTFIGSDLERPESVLVTSTDVFAADHVCGVTRVGGERIPLRDVPEGFLPNGIALTQAGEFLIANLGDEGGIWRIDADRRLHPFLLEVNGRQLRNSNFVGYDDLGRLWVSVCTQQRPRAKAFDRYTADGYIVLVDEHGARIVAEGLGFANECRVDPTGNWLYVNETMSRVLSRFPIEIVDGRARLGSKEQVYTFTDGDFPDGLNFDVEGGVWVACVVSNRVVRIDSTGRREVILEDADPLLIAEAEQKWAIDELSDAALRAGLTRTLHNVSCIAFGGDDMKTVYLGSLAGKRLATFRAEIAGARPAHWHLESVISR